MSCSLFTMKNKVKNYHYVTYGLWTIIIQWSYKDESWYLYLSSKIKKNIQYHYLEEITEWFQSLGVIFNTGAVDKLTHLIWCFFLEVYAWSCYACTPDEFCVLLLVLSHVCVWLTNRPFLTLRSSTSWLFTFAMDVARTVRYYYSLTCEKSWFKNDNSVSTMEEL